MYDKDIKILKELAADLERKLTVIYAAIDAMQAADYAAGSAAVTQKETGMAGETAFASSKCVLPGIEPDDSPLDFKPITGAPVGVNVGGGGLRSDKR